MAPPEASGEALQSPASSDASHEYEEALLEPGTDAFDDWQRICDHLSDEYPFHFANGDDTEELYSIGFGGGGYLGVDLGDVFKGRYEVIHKLGSGSSCSVWLCRDSQTNSWKAMQVLTSEASTGHPYHIINTRLENVPKREIESAHVILPIDEFTVDGHGESTHYCFVYPFFGPTLKHVRSVIEDVPGLDKRLRNFCHKAVEAISFLHKHGICHGGKEVNSSVCKNDTLITSYDRHQARKYPRQIERHREYG